MILSGDGWWRLHGLSRRAARLDKINLTHLSYIEEIFTVSPSHSILEATARRLEAVNGVNVLMKPVELDRLGVTYSLCRPARIKPWGEEAQVDDSLNVPSA